MPAVETFNLPDLGEGLADAELVSWAVAVGDTIELNQVIAEVETAKAAVELPSPYAGTVVALHAAEGDTVEVGQPFIDVDVAPEDVAPQGGRDEEVPQGGRDAEVPQGGRVGPERSGGPYRDQAAAPQDGRVDPERSGGPYRDQAAPDAEPTRTPVLVGYGVAEDAQSRRRKRPTAEPEPIEPATETEESGRPLAAPPVRKLARDAGVDLADVTATGLHGDVTRDDLERHLASVAEPDVTEPDVATSDLPEVRTPIRGVRKHTAEAMVQSAFTAPHVTEFVDVDVTPMMELVEKLSEHRRFAGVRLTPLALVAKALLVALRTNPSLNSTWDDAAQEIVTKKYVNLGIAAATPRGLMVPNIKNAQDLSLTEIAAALGELTAVAKDGKTPPTDLLGGTITITNIGVFGIDSGTPILNPGEAAILCFGAVRRRPWEWQGEVALREVTTLSLSFDHRLVDGEQGSRFLETVAEVLSDPLALISLS